jgi:CAAX prenyl protease-like protein
LTLASFLERHPWVPYVAPFALFITFLVVGSTLSGSARTEAIIRVSILLAVIVLVARPALDFRLARPVGSAVVGVGVFAVWIAPDLLIPGYREGILFQNDLVGNVQSTLTDEDRADRVVLGLRFVRAALIVPIVEELFWRGWLPRWLDHMDDFRRAKLGDYTRWSFGATAVLFALEHGSFWDVGLVAGVIYNEWMRRTRSLGDLIFSHGVTNACLSAYVLAAGRWEYW